MGYSREQRPDAALDVLSAGTALAREEQREKLHSNNRLHQTCRPVNQLRACLCREVPADHEAHSQSFGGSAPRRPKQGQSQTMAGRSGGQLREERVTDRTRES